MKNHILGTLYGMAIGDAMGSASRIVESKTLAWNITVKYTDFLVRLSGKIIISYSIQRQVSLLMIQARH